MGRLEPATWSLTALSLPTGAQETPSSSAWSCWAWVLLGSQQPVGRFFLTPLALEAA